MRPHHPRLQKQLDELGLDRSGSLPVEQLELLLERVDAAYHAADRERDQLHTVLDTLSSTTCHVDTSGSLVGMNDRGIELFQATPRQLMNQVLTDTVGFFDEDDNRLGVDDLMAEHRVERGRVERPDGTSFPASFHINPIVRDGEVHGAVVLLRDIHELLERERELQEARVEVLVARKAERAKSLFLANMSHELRTPLNAILGYSEMLHEEAVGRGDDDGMADLMRVQRAARHLTHLIGGILDLSKIDAGKMELFLEPCDLHALATECLDTVRPDADNKGLELQLDVEPDLPLARVDVTRLRQCVLNLLSNAVKFTDSGRVGLAVRTTQSTLEIEVRDTGIGIAPENVDRLFSNFTQAEASTTRRFGGTGLGLSLSRRLCRLMGGDIALDSVQGQGSVFTIAVPLVPDEAPQLDRLEGEGVTVLVVDDDPAMRDLLERTLSTAGYAVVTARNGRECLDVAKQLEPDAIVLDVLMPDVDGWSVLVQLKADPELYGIPVVLHTILEERGRGFALGAAEYLTKPVDRGRLMQVLDRFCGSRAGDVLVVDDNHEVRQVVERQLASGGWTVHLAVHGEEALEKLEEQPVDVVLLDLMMPVMDGFQFVRELRGDPERSDIPVVVMTAMELSSTERAQLDRSVQRILQKGTFGTDELLGELRQRLRR